MKIFALRTSRGAALGLAAALAVAVSGCGDMLDQLKAEEVALAALFHSPQRDNPAGGDPLPEATVFTLFFGRVDRARLIPQQDGSQSAEDGAFSGVAGADVTLRFTDKDGVERQLNVTDQGAGSYGLDSEDAPLLSFNTEPYVVTINYAGKTHRLRATPPEPAEVEQFQDSPAIEDHPAGEALTLTRVEKQGAANPLAFVHLQGVAGEGSEESWTNFPSDGMGYLRLALDDADWRADSFTVPGEHFKAQSAYVTSLTTVAKGEVVTDDGSDPLFSVSTFLAGAGASGGVLVP